MNQLKKRVILGLYYREELTALTWPEVSRLLRERRKLIKRHLHDPASLEDPRTWPDYHAVMHFSLVRRLEQLRSPLLRRWDELLERFPEAGQLYEYELKERQSPHQKKLSRRRRRARLATISKLGKDLRWLGRFEMFVDGKTTYGYPGNQPE